MRLPKSNTYGAVLCSKHFISFPLNQEDNEMVNFYQKELDRQKQLFENVNKRTVYDV